ncbi:hypothetical protein EKO27_g7617 [Xylaria grammica]|uniref:Ornithine decarboxylase antizyme n=1 Tax=Xylaria grammica TaxID=363999 RepID=A0A439CZ97_9PEZI|nr:hypothetical protein EKO27_g7617 [Xylaria grammica]
MAPMKNSNSSSSNCYGEDVARQANVLASCYLVDSAASLKGLHYCTTGAAAQAQEAQLRQRYDDQPEPHHYHHQPPRGGATFQIREECERFFCETMRAVFRGERDAVGNGSYLTGVHGVLTPPDDYPSPPSSLPRSGLNSAVNATGWMEFWDYAGGASFRAFVAEKGDEKSLFAFFDSGLVGQDLKQALIALIELADVPLGCSNVVICMDRHMPEDHAKSLMRSLQWVGFELTALDHWADELDVVSDKWFFLGMEV